MFSCDALVNAKGVWKNCSPGESILGRSMRISAGPIGEVAGGIQGLWEWHDSAEVGPLKPWFYHLPITTAQEQRQVLEGVTRMCIMSDSPENKT